MEELLKLFSFKYSTTLTAESNISDFAINLPIPINLDNTYNYELGLLWFSGWNTIFNITNENNAIKINTKTYHITPGAYEIKQIDDEINLFFPDTPAASLHLLFQLTTGRSFFNMKNCKVDFTIPNSFAALLGFSKKIYGDGGSAIKKVFSESKIKITNTLSINIECDLITGSYNNGVQNSILYSFPTNTVPRGYKFVERMNPPIYLPITRKSISCIRFRIIDQNGELINFNKENISMYLHLKQV